MKRKQFVKGMEQIAQEGAIQIFRDLGSGMEEVIVGVVGVLQLEVLEYRLRNEYNVDIRMQTLPYEHLRWIMNDPLHRGPEGQPPAAVRQPVEHQLGRAAQRTAEAFRVRQPDVLILFCNYEKRHCGPRVCNAFFASCGCTWGPKRVY